MAYCFDNRRGETCVDIYCRPQRSVQRVYRCIQAVIAIAPACRSAIALHLVLHCCNDTGEKTRWLQPMYQMETNHGPTEMVDEEISCFRTKMQWVDSFCERGTRYGLSGTTCLEYLAAVVYCHTNRQDCCLSIERCWTPSIWRGMCVCSYSYVDLPESLEYFQ